MEETLKWDFLQKKEENGKYWIHLEYTINRTHLHKIKPIKGNLYPE
jgi:hypothetical protein